MKDKCLILNFRDAKSFRGARAFGDDHRMVEFGGVVDRKNRQSSWINVPTDTLYVNHVSNVLHVLMGERPVPTFRKTCDEAHKRVDAIDSLAADASVSVRTGVHNYMGKEGILKSSRILEKMTSRKAVKNSWNKSGKGRKIVLDGVSHDWDSCNLSWDRIQWHVGKELFAEFDKIATTILSPGYSSRPVLRVFEELHSHRGNQLLIDWCSNPEVPESYRAILLQGKVSGQYFHQSGYGKLAYVFLSTFSRGVEDVSSISGKIFIPVDDSDLELVRRGPGFATILDGGIVTIDSVEDMSDLLVVGSKPVFKGE